MNSLLNISVLFSLFVACVMAILGQLFSARGSEVTTNTPAKECETKTEVIKCTQPASEKKQPKNKAKKQACLTFERNIKNKV
ncbi:MAG: hypothetical protein NZ551_09250 [Microscillaceae bacterium]|nr:hypothetical protein [Microscillaceae bacterium]MDW8461386.1 hypothetical protein [Cytophagales bacterium]